ncbi:MAG TPA: DNA methyltransferase, partial [Tissierellaceae bacterium]|nr:DNA methyltransferase [Tissierellaceae bacterium]
GHTRLLAARKIGMTEIPTIQVGDLTEQQIKAFRIADNKTSEFAEWDMELLEIEIEGLDDIFTGFDDEELSDLFGEDKEVEEDDFEIELPDEPKAKLGEIYQLGRHRLMCGDSISEEEIDKLMDGNKADMVHTDPPYGMKKEKDGVLNDNLNYNDLLEFNKKWIPLTFDSLKDNGSWYCWGIDEPLMDIYSEILKPMINSQKATFRNLITWDKGYGQGQLSNLFRMYATADEKCLFVMCGVQGFSNNTEDYFEGWDSIRLYLEQEAKKVGLNAKKLKEITGVGMYSHWFTKSQWVFIPEEHYKKIQNHYNGAAFKQEHEAFKQEHEALKQEYEALKQEWYKTRAYFNNTHDNMNNVWHISRTGNEEKELTGGHATPKPLALCARAIKSSSREEEIVLDVFGGSGSTLMACEKLNRICYMMELDEKYVDVIINRWEQYTGQKAVLISE